MRRTRLSPDLTSAIAGGKSRNHGCTQALSPDDPMDQSLKGPPGAFIPYQGLKGTQIGVTLPPVTLAQFHIASFAPQFRGALYSYLALGGRLALVSTSNFSLSSIYVRISDSNTLTMN
jgi:hypothetical protein